MPKFSIIIPTYNRDTLLVRCIESVLAQSLDDLEVIVADDGSTDSTESRIAEFCKRDHRVRYVRQENQGAGAARNLGATHATGEFLVFLDSDDEVRGHWIAAFDRRIGETQAAVVCCGCEFRDEKGLTDHVRLPTEPHASPLHQWGFFFTGTFAIHNDLFHSTTGYNPELQANQHSDLRFRLLPLLQQRELKLACIQECNVVRHSHSGPNIRSNSRAVYESGEFILRVHGDLLLEDPRSYADWCAALGGCALRLGEQGKARKWFWSALRHHPRSTRNYLRLLMCCVPAAPQLIEKLRSALGSRT